MNDVEREACHTEGQRRPKHQTTVLTSRQREDAGERSVVRGSFRCSSRLTTRAERSKGPCLRSLIRLTPTLKCWSWTTVRRTTPLSWFGAWRMLITGSSSCKRQMAEWYQPATMV